MEDRQKERKSRFIADIEDIEILGDKKPDPQQVMEAERVLGKILKDKRKKFSNDSSARR
jgi:hypothetical protein